MTDNLLPALKPAEFAVLLGTGERRARMISGELEALGFALEVGQNGARHVPAALAAAVRDARDDGRDLRDLRLDPDLASYLRKGRTTDHLDPLDALIEVAAEVAIVRETLGILNEALRGGTWRSGFVLPTDWRSIALPNPKAHL